MEGSGSQLMLWHLCRTDAWGYDTFCEMVVAAYDEESAKQIHPTGRLNWNGSNWVSEGGKQEFTPTWVNPDSIDIECIGLASNNLLNKQIIITDFNAG
jgi:hypothetical protein